MDFRTAMAKAQASRGTATQMPQYQCHKKVWALKIKEIIHKELPKWKDATCKGSFAFGSACGMCERCTWEREHGPEMRVCIVPEESHLAPVLVGREYLAKHKPQVGGYYVVYEDGYVSYSPAAAFESGYTILDNLQMARISYVTEDGLHHTDEIRLTAHPVVSVEHLRVGDVEITKKSTTLFTKTGSEK